MKQRRVELDDEEDVCLKKMVKKEKEISRARILLLLDRGKKIKDIADYLDISVSTVNKIKKRYLDEGLESALNDKPRSGQPQKYDVEKETEIIALACTNPPKGRKQWTVRLIASELKNKPGFETISRESVRIILKKAKQNHGKKECGV
ncbi:hypothetical protein MBFIL_08820 [Methanobrevibacter filiformis]|uniref:Transposase n=1 Tax=Methanobrevibacter filiformis TaxID=55758 RepID=A0A166CDU5_9EURY|nr:hypothetical protein MBFIL_08820 [Methanobrevibacter filiformis]